MRRQTLFLIPVLLGALAASFFLGLRSQRSRRALTAAWGRVEAQGLSFELPPDASGPFQAPGSPWSATEFRSGVLGGVRIARERPRGDLDGALREWFALPGPLAGPITCNLQGQLSQARPVTAFGPSGHVLRRQGRDFVAVCVFDLGGFRYWVQARARDGSRETLACFDRMLLSLRGPEGAGTDPALKADLAAAEAGLAPGLVQDLAWTAALPVGAMLLALAVVYGAGRLSGKPARDGAGSSYEASGVEVCLGNRFQRKYFDAALTIRNGRLTVHTYGTPFLDVPLASLPGRVSEGTAWFGPPYLDLALEGGLDYRKNKLLYGLWSGSTRLRIYTEDVRRLRLALGA